MALKDALDEISDPLSESSLSGDTVVDDEAFVDRDHDAMRFAAQAPARMLLTFFG